MEKSLGDNKILLPHHVQLNLCETRLPYRQGRKLTAVKVYSIATESNHLLIFGVPSLNLRQETKILFMKFGKLLQFNISKNHASEPFTETYHVQYERIQSARIAKRTLDTKNYYGGSLHVCYAPELESINETHQKLIQRHNSVLLRLKSLQKEEEGLIEETVFKTSSSVSGDEIPNCDKQLLNMGEINVIQSENNSLKKKRKINNDVASVKRFKPCFINQSCSKPANNTLLSDNETNSSNVKRCPGDVTEIEIVDCTSLDKTTISNINEALNYNKFGGEVVFKLPVNPVNKIKFNVNKKSLL